MAVGQPDMKILVVDDFPTMRRIVKTLFRQNGFTNFIEAEDGAQGYDTLKQNPDVEFIVSDWNMPNMTGIELLENLTKEGVKLKFGFVTTEATPDMRQRATAAGASFLISKPFTPESFKEILGAHIK